MGLLTESMKKSLEIHGIPEETLRGYLVALGGDDTSNETITGPGWTAAVTKLPDYRLGRLIMCCFRVEMAGEETAVREAWRRFELRVLRPGG